MGETRVVRHVEAPKEVVFDTVADIGNLTGVIDAITDVEFLSETHRGVGTVFRETRTKHGKASTTTREVTEYVAPEHIRLVSDQGGTVWDSVFSVRTQGNGSELELVMQARPRTTTARLLVPLTGRLVTRAIAAELDAVKAHCEALD